MTSVEFDHADIFKDEDHVLRVFKDFAAGLNRQSSLIVFGGDQNALDVAGTAKCGVMVYGKVGDSGWRLGKIDLQPPWSRFEVFKGGELYGRFETMLVGGN